MDAKASINEEEGLETLRGGGGNVTTSDTGVQFPMTNLAPIPDFYSFARKAIDTTPLASRFAGRDHVRLMNDAIKASFTSIDDFLRHMRQQQALAAREDSKLSKIVEFNGDYDKKHTLEHQREHLTTPAGTQWMTDRVIDRELKTKVYERKYRIPSMLPPSSSSAAVADQKMGIVEVGVDEQADAATEPEQLRGGGGPRIAGDRSNGRGPVKSKLSQYEGNVGDSRPSTAQSIDRLKNEMKRINGWEHPLCPVCDKVVYIADKVTFECYAYHKTCFRCRKCKRRLMPVSAVRVRGHPYCEVHGAVLLRRRSNILHSAIGRRRQSGGGSSSTYGALGTKLETSAAAAESAGPSESGSSPFKEDHALPDTRQHRRRVSRYRRRSSGRVRTAARHPTRRESAGIDDVKRLANDGERPLQPDSDQRPTYASQALRDFMDATADLIQSEQSTTLGRAAEIENAGSMSGKKSGNGSSQTEGDETRHVVRPASHARSVTLVTSPSKSVFRSTGSGQESVYKPDIVNSLRQEASRMMAEEEERRHSANRSSSQEGYQTPRGSSIAENLTENKATPDQDGLTSISSQFDHFREDPTDKFSPMLARMRPGPFGQAPPGYFAASPFTVLDPKLGGNSQAR
ncbi:Pollen-specific protein [Spiromyces aspiralis]|uniref:Pollen-specific protein n=1 Tax=Spiromyces aspiralis TaxID=68401 RepID=A0ACC1HSI3_9FUNG|nr:Pollen-specific protein [Spiromyces aspiralis]